MQIDSTKVHDLLNAIAIECCGNSDIVACVKTMRKELIDIEAETALWNSKAKYHEALEGLKDR